MTKSKLIGIFHMGRIDAGDDVFGGSHTAYDRLLRDLAREQGDEREQVEDEIDTDLNESANGWTA